MTTRPLIPTLRDAMRLSALVDDCMVWLERNRRRAPGTLRQYRLAYDQFRAHLVITQLDDDVRNFNASTVLAWSEGLAARGVDGNTIRGKLAALSTLAKFGMMRTQGRRFVLTSNPTKTFVWPRYVAPKTDFLRPDELRAFLAVPRPLGESIARDLFIDTGLRVAELAGADVGDIIEAGGHVTLAVTVKGRREGHFPISAPVADALRDYLLQRNMPDPGEPLLTNTRGQRYTTGALSELMRRIGKAAGITRIPSRAHRLRHTANVIARIAKVDPYTRSRLLAHGSMRTLERYEHVLPAELHEAREAQRAALERYVFQSDFSNKPPDPPANPAS